MAVASRPVSRAWCYTSAAAKRMPENFKMISQKCTLTDDSSKRKCLLEASKPQKIDYDKFINARSKKRTPSALREITKKLSEIPQAISFAVGVPNVNTFPFQEMSIKLKDDFSYKLEGKELEAALQYMPTSGYPPLVKQLKEIQDRTHGPQDWTRTQSILVTNGSSEPMACVFDMVLNEGDPILLPIPLYTGPPDYLRPFGLECIGLEQDKDGVQPQQLRQILEERARQNKPIPKIMYINPTACNPTGRNLSLDRKQEIYRIACEYDFLILEDDPYYFLHFMDEDMPTLLSMDVEGRVIRADSFSKILSLGLRLGYVTGPRQLIRQEDMPTLLSMDVEGRVIRADSFSKILSSGLRLGYVTGPRQLIRQVELHMQVSTLHCSALSQASEMNVDCDAAQHLHHHSLGSTTTATTLVVVSKLLDHWGYDRYIEHVQGVKRFYRERRDLMLAACDRHLKGLVEWEVSMGGMFLWVRVPALQDSWELATKLCLDRFLLLVPGHPFTGELTPPHYNYVRLSYSIATPSQMEEGTKLLAQIIQEVKDRNASSNKSL